MNANYNWDNKSVRVITSYKRTEGERAKAQDISRKAFQKWLQCNYIRMLNDLQIKTYTFELQADANCEALKRYVLKQVYIEKR